MSRKPADTAVAQTFSTLRLQQRGRVLIVSVDAPPFNYFTAQMQQDFNRLVDAVDADESIGAVVVTGAPEARYMLHFELSDVLAATERSPALSWRAARALFGTVRAAARLGARGLVARTPAAGLVTVLGFHETALKLLRSPAVWIGAVNGPTAGAGLELSLFFDIRIAGEQQARFSLTELTIALNAPLGGQRLALLMGPSRAIEFMLEARQYDAREALGMNLVNRVVEDERLVDEAVDLATRYASRPRPQVARQKRIFNEGVSMAPRRALFLEAVAQLTSASSPTLHAAVTRWLEMRSRTSGDSVWLTDPQPWLDGTALDMNASREKSVIRSDRPSR
jgi:enoyl-CoA hydratase